MSTRFTIYCQDHEVSGPHIRRHHSSAIFMEQGSARFFPISVDEDAAGEWGSFLLEHEFCDLQLVRELESKRAAEKRREQERAERAEHERPKFKLHADGALEPL